MIIRDNAPRTALVAGAAHSFDVTFSPQMRRWPRVTSPFPVRDII